MFSPESTKLALDILQNEIPFAIWETVWRNDNLIPRTCCEPSARRIACSRRKRAEYCHYQSLYYRCLMRS